MKNRTLRLMLLTSLALSPLVASAQRDSTQLSPNKIKSTGLMVMTKDKQSEQRMTAAAKRMNVDRHAFELNPSLRVSLTPDLTITNVGMGHDLVSGNIVHIVVVENKGKVDAGPCTGEPEGLPTSQRSAWSSSRSPPESSSAASKVRRSTAASAARPSPAS